MSAAVNAAWVWSAGSVSQSEAGSRAVSDPVLDSVVRLRQGDASALEPLIEATQSRAWQIAYSILQDRQEVEDALQDAYLSVFQNLSQLKEPQAFWGWFKRILVHRCLRLRQRNPLEVLQDEEDQRSSPQQPLEDRLDVAEAFKKLSLTDRTVLALREILDLPYEEIAQQLQVPLNTVRTRIYNARNRLFRLFTQGSQGGAKS